MENLAEIRTKKGMTQAELAEACGVTQKTISALEVDRRKPSYDLLLKLTKALDVTPNELLTDPREKLEAELQAKIESGEMTADEAEHEYQNRYNPEPRYCGQEW